MQVSHVAAWSLKFIKNICILHSILTVTYKWHIKVSSNVLTLTEKFLKKKHKFEIHIWKKKWLTYLYLCQCKLIEVLANVHLMAIYLNLSVIYIYCDTFCGIYLNLLQHLHSTLTLQHDVAVYMSWSVSVSRAFYLHLLIIHVLCILWVYKCYRTCINRKTKCEKLRLLILVSCNLWQYHFNR